MINPTGYTALDLVGFTDRGTYASNVNYVKNDIVHYGGNLWRCKIDDTMNVTPAEGENWTVFVGEPTNLVERIIAPLEENPATVAYAAGRQIIYDDWLWEVIDDIAVGDPLIDYAVDPTNANIKKAVPVETQLLDLKAKVGSLTDLTTDSKASLVSAINEVDSHADEAQSTATQAQQMLAPIQTTLTASQAYAIGDQFVYNGLLYKATAAIAQGGTIVIDGNATLADCVTGQIKALVNDNQYTAFSYVVPTYGGRIYVRKHGRTVNIILSEIGVDTIIPVETSVLLYTLPEEYRPTATILAIGTVSAAIVGKTFRCQILSSGTITVRSSEADITSTRLSVTYNT